MDGFDRANSVFTSRVGEVLGNLRVRETHSFFVRNQGELFRREGMRGDLKSALSRALNLKDASEAVLYRGLVLQLYGAFERLITDIAEAVLIAAQSKASRYGDLDRDLRDAHTVGAARLLAKTYDRTINGVPFDFATLQLDIAACFSNTNPYRLSVGAITALLGVCTADRVDWVFETLKLGKAFDDSLGRDPAIKAWAGKAGTREAFNLARDQLNETVRLRNQIAHGAADPEVLDIKVKETAEFLNGVGPGATSEGQSEELMTFVSAFRPGANVCSC